jgi:hypothetical protein
MAKTNYNPDQIAEWMKQKRPTTGAAPQLVTPDASEPAAAAIASDEHTTSPVVSLGVVPATHSEPPAAPPVAASRERAATPSLARRAVDDAPDPEPESAAEVPTGKKLTAIVSEDVFLGVYKYQADLRSKKGMRAGDTKIGRVVDELLRKGLGLNAGAVPRPK